MGMYTEMHFNVELNEDVPLSVIRVLSYMIDNEEFDFPDFPDHPLFETPRWKSMFQTDSYYFSSDTRSTLRFDNISKSWFLCLRFNLKNYGSEIEKFIDWIMPYVYACEGDFLGFYRYEEDNIPTLIYYPEGEK